MSKEGGLLISSVFFDNQSSSGQAKYWRKSVLLNWCICSFIFIVYDYLINETQIFTFGVH
jgi:hypothetical protein